MNRDYFYTESLTVGYQGCPIDQRYCHWIEKGGNPDIDRSEWCGKTTILKSLIRQLKP